MSRVTGDVERPRDGRELWVTTSWDDGYPLDMRLAALLQRYGVRGTFYVPIRSQLPVITPAQIRELAAQFDIGGHTVSHVQLDRIPAQSAREEIFESNRRIEDITGARCAMFCPPSGRYRRAHVRDAREAGYIGLRTVELMSVAYPSSRDGLVMLPATVQLYRHNASTYLKNACKRGRWKNFEIFLRHAKGRDLVEATETLLEHLSEAGGVLHLWGHSWELEHSSLWGALESILKLLWSCRDRCRFVSNAELCARFAAAASLGPAKEIPGRSEDLPFVIVNQSHH